MVSIHGRDRYTQDSDEGAQGPGNDVGGRMERVAMRVQQQGMLQSEETSMCANTNIKRMRKRVL